MLYPNKTLWIIQKNDHKNHVVSKQKFMDYIEKMTIENHVVPK